MRGIEGSDPTPSARSPQLRQAALPFYCMNDYPNPKPKARDKMPLDETQPITRQVQSEIARQVLHRCDVFDNGVQGLTCQAADLHQRLTGFHESVGVNQPLDVSIISCAHGARLRH